MVLLLAGYCVLNRTANRLRPSIKSSCTCHVCFVNKWFLQFKCYHNFDYSCIYIYIYTYTGLVKIVIYIYIYTGLVKIMLYIYNTILTNPVYTTILTNPVSLYV